MTRIKIRAGYYELENGYEVELLNQSAEFYPGDDYYNTWRVYAPSGDTWLHHFSTLREAVRAIEDTK